MSLHSNLVFRYLQYTVHVKSWRLLNCQFCNIHFIDNPKDFCLRLRLCCLPYASWYASWDYQQDQRHRSRTPIGNLAIGFNPCQT